MKGSVCVGYDLTDGGYVLLGGAGSLFTLIG